MISTIEQKRLEKDIERKCVEHAEDQEWMTVKTDLAKRGWPDRFFFGPSSQLLIVEFKRPGLKPTKKQQAIHDRLAVLGQPVSIVTSLDQFKQLLATL